MDQIKEKTPINPKRRQFGIRHLLCATLVAALAISLAPYHSKVLPDYRELAFWCTIMFFGGYSRWLGWKLNWPPGLLGRCAIAFFTASMGCAGTILLMSYDGSWPEVIRRIPLGLGASAIIGGIYFGAVIEFAFWLPSVLHSAIFNPTHNLQDRSKQCDELKDESTLRSRAKYKG